MKIGILTQPLHNNYGGILQAYALQKVLKDMGHTPWIINRISGKRSHFRKAGSFLKIILYRYLMQKDNIPSPFKKKMIISEQEKQIISKYTSEFVTKYIQPITPKIDNNIRLKEIANEDFDAFIVGSDQVWRLHYSPNILNYYLDFISEKHNIKKIAYAASFGLPEWHYPKRITRKVQKLAHKFGAISVREANAVKLCHEKLKVDATHVLDPTMLLCKQDYIDLVNNENKTFSSGKLMVYMLDSSLEKKSLINSISQILGIKPFEIMPKEKLTNETRHKIENCIYPPVTNWLHGFMDAKFVITDSFHGCVFSIIFNVPFLVIGNEKRGMARFDSLLQTFGLEDRLLINISDFNLDKINNSINWASVNNKLNIELKKSFTFLEKSLLPN